MTPVTKTDGIAAALKAYRDAGCEPPDIICNCPYQGLPPFKCSSSGICAWN
jgi:hypothetical protein